MARPGIDPVKRAAIVVALHERAGSCSRNGLAREFGVAPSTVGKIAADEGLVDVFDRTAVARASHAKKMDNRSRRAALVELYLDDAEKIRERLWKPAEQMTVTGEVVMLSLPGARDVRDFAMAGSSLLKATLDVEKHDTVDGGADDAKSMLLGVAEGLRSLYRAADLGTERSPI